MLNFCPTPRYFDRYKLRRDINDFIRRIRLKEYFYGGDNVEGNFSNVPAFRNKSILSSFNNDGRVYSNLLPEERQALEDLKSYDNIVIKEADKGSGVVIMDKERYLNKAVRQLGDQTVYRETASDLTQEISKLVNNRI